MTRVRDKIGALAVSAVCILGVAAAPVPAQEGVPAGTIRPAAAVAERQARETTARVVETAAGRLAYKAAAGTLALKGKSGERTAEIFHTTYVVDAPVRSRPVTFVFNGGPGAASAFLHLGGLGPRIVPFNANGSAALRPVQFIDNRDTWLDFTDLVFVDPVGTGFSDAPGGEAEASSRFFGVEKDADALAEFVRLYLAKAGRPLDPVFLVGASYGSFRAALLAKRLLRDGLDVRGAVLVSPALDFSLIWGSQITLLPTALVLPSLACARQELEFGAAADTAECEAAERFARGPYLSHLASGMRPDPAIESEVARYTGLPLDHVARRFGRVGARDFARVHRQSRDRALSLYDAGISAPLERPAGDNPADPVLDHAVSVLAPAFTAYARDELGFVTDGPYRLLNREVRAKWDFGTSPQRQGYAGALDELQAARTQRPALRILIASGYTDLVTPFATARFMVDQLRPIEGAVPVDVEVYRGGHMMYLRPESRRLLFTHARNLYGAAMSSRTQ